MRWAAGGEGTRALKVGRPTRVRHPPLRGWGKG